MGDLRFSRAYETIRDSPNRIGAIRQLSDEGVIIALGGASRGSDPLLANVLATEAMNRVQRGRRVLASVSDGVIVLDRDGTITLVNAAAESLLGWLSQEVVGRHVRDLLGGGDRDLEGRGVDLALLPVTSGVSTENKLVTLLARDGSSFRTLLRSSPITAEGNVIGLVLVLPHGPPNPDAVAGNVQAPRGDPPLVLSRFAAPVDARISATSRPRIMIVEDEAVVAMSLDDTLTRMGYDVVAVVPTGEAAIETALAEHLDLVLMDVMLQGELDGVAAAAAIHASVEVPVIYLTAFSDDETLKRAKVAEPSGYLVKPYAEHELHAAVEVALHNSTLGRERTRAKEALLSREKLLQEIVDNTPVVIYLKDLEGRYLLVNKQFERVCGVVRAQVNGKSGAGVLSPALLAAFDANHDEVIRDGHAVEFEQSFRDDEGPHTYASLKFPLRDSDGLISGVCGVSTDITHRGATHQLKLAHDAQQNAYLELDAFTRHVAHDLRAPARRIAVLTESLVEEEGERPDSPKGAIVTRLRAESRRLDALVTDLLEFSRSGASQVDAKVIDLTSMTRSVVAEISGREPARQVDVSIEEGVKVRADPVLLRLVMENLLENAWKYSSKDPHPSIEFGTSPGAGGETNYYVRDNGVGFPTAEAARLFQPFHRLPSAADFPGTGLGLSSVRRIIQSHGGRTWAEGALGCGATFFFTLPASR